MPVAAVGSPACCAPTMIPGPKPVTAFPGLTPRSPVIEVRPVFVTVEPARTAKFEADPRTTGAWLQAATAQRAQSHPGEDRARLRPPESAARALLYLLGPDGASHNGRTVEL